MKTTKDGVEVERVEISREDVEAMDCPVCPGKAGEWCRCSIGRGHTRSMHKQHHERVDAAFERKAKETECTTN